MTRISRYSLWLVPDTASAAYRVLTGCIAEIAQEYQTLNFVPHATLLGGIDGNETDILAKTKKLAESVTPYEIELGETGSNGIYFQILFSKVRQTEAVMQANAVAQAVFAVDQGKYFPHVSLAYGDLLPQTVTSLQQFIAERHPLVVKTTFLAQSIELWCTEGKAKDWYKVSAFPFKS